jgi:hypothetical protein
MKLNKCISCGNYSANNWNEARMYYVMCKCGKRTKSFGSHKGASNEWNTINNLNESKNN